MSERKEFDAIVVGSGPNGLSAAIVLQQAGLSVLLVEAKDTVGGGMRTAELTLPGFHHDVCSAIHPMALMSPFFKQLPLKDFGLEWIIPPVAVAHPFDDGHAAIAKASLEETATLLNEDKKAYLDLLGPVIRNWPLIDNDILGPLKFPEHPKAFLSFGLKAIQSANALAKKFQTKEAKGLWAGMAAHAKLPLTFSTTSAISLVLTAAAHIVGWPIPKGGSQSLADALKNYFISLGGKIETNFYVRSLSQLPSSRAVLFDVGPKQLLQIAGNSLSDFYSWQLRRYKYGLGIFKLDWALDGPVPFTADPCRQAGTIHIGNTFEEIKTSEHQTWNGLHPEKPFVLFAQQSLFDPTRAPIGQHTAWAYCHVPNGSKKNMTQAIENQVERFAPGFKDLIIGRHSMNTEQLEDYNANYTGGDIVGGAATLSQLFTRPALRYSPYRSSAKGLYLCSASTPPGGGVHGLCGYHAAQRVLKDLFNNK